MTLPFAQDPAAVPLNVVFPDEYRATARTIVRDFAYIGGCMISFVVGLAAIFG